MEIITNEQIKQLEVEANKARDYVVEALCALALDGAYDREAAVANGMGRDSLRRLDGTTQSEAMAECERVINETRARQVV